MQQQVIGYYFALEPLYKGRWLEIDQHCPDCPFEALRYALGDILHKIVFRKDGRGKVIIRVDARSLLRDYAYWSALQVTNFWYSGIVYQYLETKDEKFKDEAWALARETMHNYSHQNARTTRRATDAAHATFYAIDSRSAAYAALMASSYAMDALDDEERFSSEFNRRIKELLGKKEERKNA